MTTYPNDADGAVLADLAAQGMDMSQPLVIEFPVAVPDEAAANKTLKAMMGEEFSSAYLKLKEKEWNSYCSHFSKWETENTLDI